MIKIMLVEDDKSLREIYGVRLLAEGYDIVSAGDGEEALAMAIKERPQLIISDVMMPKVSGYDMLDILRSTTETKSIRVIMMTALSSEEQRARAESLGADRYLVKSQVGIEDVVRVVHEVLGDTTTTAPAEAPTVSTQPATPAPTPQSTLPATPATPAAPTASPPAPATPSATVQPPTTPTPTIAPPQSTAPATTPQAPAATPVTQPANPPTAQPSQPKPVEPAPTVRPLEPPKPASLKSRVIQPLSDPNVSPIDINELLNKELAKEASLAGSSISAIPTTAEEKALVEEQLESFQPPEPTPVEAPTPVATQPVPAPESLMPTPGLSTAPTTPPTATAQPTEATVAPEVTTTIVDPSQPSTTA